MANAGLTNTISGEVLFKEVVRPVESATVYVRCEDVSRVGDVSSQILAQTVIPRVVIDTRRMEPIAFTLECATAPPLARLNLSVHVDVSGSGTIEVGDYITMVAVPVTIPASNLRVTVEPVM